MAHRSRRSVIRMNDLIGERRHVEAGFIALNPSA
jgi:hypothetical protein